MNSYSVMTDLAAAEGLASAALSASFPQSLGAVVGALDDPQAPARALDWMKHPHIFCKWHSMPSKVGL